MSLFSIMNLSANALNANQLGLRTVANNISNAQTEGYIRQELVVTSAPTQRIGRLELGTGVQVLGVQQQIDEFVASRLREAKGDLASSTAHQDVFREIEAMLGELEESDLSSGLSRFFSSIHDVVNQPDSEAVRNVTVLEADQLATDIRRHDARFREMRKQINTEIADAVTDVNRLLHEVADLNVKIAQAEGTLQIDGGAVGLRDQRLLALNSLSELIDIRTTEQESGTVTVHANGEFLVFDGTARQLEIDQVADRGIQLNNIRIADTEAPVRSQAGRIGGLLAARDQTLAGVIDQFDEFSRTLIFEFNRVFTSGQGLEGYQSVASEHRIEDRTWALDSVGLPFEPNNGSFKVLTWNSETGQQETTDVFIRLNGLNDDTTLNDVRASIDAIDGLTSRIDEDNRLIIETDRPEIEFGFAEDTSGTLAALGIATFFSGSTAATIGIKDEIRESPAKFASSADGFGVDSTIAVRLAAFADEPLEAQNSRSISQVYEQFTIGVTQASAAANALVEGAAVFHNTLESEHLSIIGVSLDEEAVKMLAYQRAFQATARVIQTASSLLELLVTL